MLRWALVTALAAALVAAVASLLAIALGAPITFGIARAALALVLCAGAWRALSGTLGVRRQPLR